MNGLFIAAVAIFGAVVLILLVLLAGANKRLRPYKGIIDLRAEQVALENGIASLKQQRQVSEAEAQARLAALKGRETELQSSVAQIERELTTLRGDMDFVEHGLYEPVFDFETSDAYRQAVGDLRQLQKDMIKAGSAVEWSTEWKVEGSRAKGKQMENQYTRLMLRAFNGECDALIAKVKYDNIQAFMTRMTSLYEAVNKLGRSNNCAISQGYFRLKLDELRLEHEYQERKQAEREEQRQIREQMREEEAARREIERAIMEAEREQLRYEKALATARAEVENAVGDKQAKLRLEIERLQEMLAEAQTNRERAVSRAQMTRSGYVYIISNIGSFGDDVYKIGMTRRLDPMDRVNELGDASVPFAFDIHAMIFTDDAPGLETALHRAFALRRVNRVNHRKEFFRVSLNDVAAEAKKHKADVQFTIKASAEEYWKTRAILAEEGRGATMQA